jgi:hypothetical protein
MHVKVNGLQAIQARITRPLTGPWSAEFSLDANETVDEGTDAIITIADYMEFAGVVTRSGQHNGRSEIRVVGGRATINEWVDGKSYYRPKFGIILKDILTDCGEELDTDSIDGAIMATALPHWCRANNPARREMRLLLDYLGLNWRILPNGLVWAGFEEWPDGIISEYLIEEEDYRAGRVVIAADVPTISPGEVFVDKFVQTVVHMLDKNKLRTELVFV